MNGIREVLQRINRIEFNVLDIINEENYRVSINDSHVAEKTQQGFKVTYTRKIFFEPEGIFQLEVTADVEFIVDISDANNNLIEGNIAELLSSHSTAIEQISLLIANISSSMGKAPIITPPYYVLDTAL